MSPEEISGVRGRVLGLYPALASLPDPELFALLRGAELVRVPAGALLFDEQQRCTTFPMLIEGAVRVSKVAASGRELQLYRVRPGEACVLTSSCLLGHAPYTARGVAETDVLLITLGGDQFSALIGTSAAFRDYVFSLFAERLAELMQLVEAVAFQRLDQRLAALLLGRGRLVRTTHQQLADELGSVREIVSRLLKSFAEQGWISVGREQLEIVDPQALRHLAGTSRPSGG